MHDEIIIELDADWNDQDSKEKGYSVPNQKQIAEINVLWNKQPMKSQV